MSVRWIFFGSTPLLFFFILLENTYSASAEISWKLRFSAQNSLPAEKISVQSVPEDLALRCTGLLWALFCRNRQLGLRFYETCAPVGARVCFKAKTNGQEPCHHPQCKLRELWATQWCSVSWQVSCLRSTKIACPRCNGPMTCDRNPKQRAKEIMRTGTCTHVSAWKWHR